MGYNLINFIYITQKIITSLVTIIILALVSAEAVQSVLFSMISDSS
jgi:hypothetical protein